MSIFGSIGNVLGNIGSTVKKAVTDTGHAVGAVADNKWTKTALAAALAATGVGAPAAAAIMASEGLLGGALKSGGNLGTAVKGGITGAVTGGVAGKAGSVLKGVLSTAAPVLGGGGGTVGPDGTVENGGAAGDAETGGRDWSSILGGLISGGGSDGKGNLGALGDLAGNLTDGGAGGGSSLLDKLMLGGSAAAAAADAMDKKGLRDDAKKYATEAYDAKAPIRDRALSLLKDPKTPDLTSLFDDPGNVYDQARRSRVASLASAQPAPTAAAAPHASEGADLISRLTPTPANDTQPTAPSGGMVATLMSKLAPQVASDTKPSLSTITPLARRLLASTASPMMQRAV